MNIQSQAHNYFRTAAHSGIRGNLRRQQGRDLPGGMIIFSAVGKILLVVLPLVLIINLWLVSATGSVENRIVTEQQALFQVTNDNIILRTEKARLLSPAHMQVVAADRLSLMMPEPGQIQRM